MMTPTTIEYHTMLVNSAQDSRTLYEAAIPQRLPEFRVSFVNSFDDALYMAQSKSLDCAIIDLAAGRYDEGIKLCQQLKSTLKSAQPAILLIGDHHLSPEQRQAGHQAGADDFILRPLLIDEIAAKMKVLLRVKHAEEQLRRNNARLARLAEDRIHELRESDARFKFLFETSRDAVLMWLLDADGRDMKIIRANDIACRMLHYSQDEILHTSIFDLLPEDRRTVLATRLESIIKHKQLYFETILRDKLGQPAPVGVHASAYESEALQVKPKFKRMPCS